MFRPAFAAVVICLVSGCGSGKGVHAGAGSDCIDADADGFGVGLGCSRRDCDDADPVVGLAADCDARDRSDPPACDDPESCACLACERTCAGPAADCDDWADEEQSGSVVETDEGWLTLEGRRHVIWIPSGPDVYRVDSRDAHIEAAFRTGPDAEWTGAWSNAVDDAGNLYVTNYSWLDGTASMSKIGADPASCIDRNGDGVIQTSTSWDQVLGFVSHEQWDDECILWHTLFSQPWAWTYGLVLQSATDITPEMGWAPIYAESRVAQFDPETGDLTGLDVATPNFYPWAGAVDREGWLWLDGYGLSDPYYGLARFDTANPDATFEIVPVPDQGGWQIAFDENDTPWLSGMDVYRYDRASGSWDPAGLERGALIVPDGRGSIWAAAGPSQTVWRISNDDEMRVHSIDVGAWVYGLAVDLDGKAWTLGWLEDETGDLSTIDLETEQVDRVLEDCGGRRCLIPPWEEWERWWGDLGDPEDWAQWYGEWGWGGNWGWGWGWGWGDLTGHLRPNAVSSTGSWVRSFEGCPEGTDWKTVTVDADAPAETTVVLSARTAATPEEAQSAAWVSLGSVSAGAIDLDDAFSAAAIEDGLVLELGIDLESNRGVSPVVRGVELEWRCRESLE